MECASKRGSSKSLNLPWPKLPYLLFPILPENLLLNVILLGLVSVHCYYSNDPLHFLAMHLLESIYFYQHIYKRNIYIFLGLVLAVQKWRPYLLGRQLWYGPTIKTSNIPVLEDYHYDTATLVAQISRFWLYCGVLIYLLKLLFTSFICRLYKFCYILFLLLTYKFYVKFICLIFDPHNSCLITVLKITA